MDKKYEFNDLKNIMKKLRGVDGCPWDREQTKESLKKYVLEEAYEVIDAVDNGSYDDICEELGDLLLQIVFISQIASEKNEFTLDDVTNCICTKMINRHPHVFGDEKLLTSEEVNEKWQQIKMTEKSMNSYTQSMKSIPNAIPALLRSSKIQHKAAKVGFDWDTPQQAFEKVFEEIEEVKELIGTNQTDKITKEVGDVLFSVVNVARLLGIDAETALMGTNDKFVNRFDYIEKNSIAIGKTIEEMTLSQMDKLWEESKKYFS